MSDWVAINRCPLCESAERDPWLNAMGVELVRCRSCGHRHSAVVLAPDTLALDYYDEPDAAIEARTQRAKLQRFGEYLDLLGQRAEGGRVLDVGCNAGELLALFKARGYRPFGIEMSPGPARSASKRLGVEIWQGRAEDCLPESERFELITMSHVLEHIHEPRKLLRRLRDALVPGAQLLIEVPNAEDRMLAVWGGLYRPLCPGDHVSFFDARGLSRTLEASGLRVRQIASVTHARDLVYPSLLSAIDGLRRASPRSKSGVQAQTRYRGKLRRPIRHAIDVALDALDPGVLRATRSWSTRLRGAVLIAVAEAAV